MASINLGITHNIAAPKRIYGNAFDEQYGLELLPRNLNEAMDVFKGSNVQRLLDSILS